MQIFITLFLTLIFATSAIATNDKKKEHNEEAAKDKHEILKEEPHQEINHH